MSYLVVHGEFRRDDNERALVTKAIETDAKVVIFDSPGGNAYAAMRFGRAIRAAGLNTLQARPLECASACSMAFMGGVMRVAESGSIGVHRAAFGQDAEMDSSTAVAAIQAGTADLIAYLVEMGVDPRLMQLALSVDSTDMRYLTTAEMSELRVTSNGDASGNALPSSNGLASLPGSNFGSDQPGGSENEVAAGEQLAALPHTPPLSTPQINKPNRLALYRGLDFVGRDIQSLSLADAPACASACLGTDQCRAFTFNTATSPARGPNCFLKSSQGELDGNFVAISGMLLGRMEPDAVAMSFGVIDPARNLYQDADATGGDLSRTPLPSIHTPFECRLACVQNGACAGFSFVAAKKQCWLKGEIGQLRKRPGIVTGLKTAMSFEPTHVPIGE
ncbi:PAN domain-containing protein [Aureimonas phyllosphaerae]|uniref:Apple domain-containing protein n=1 Tax=Aureimonas phyllosphaerae TaxID=1166078 RepID=A0A7W6BXF1_9HYPH|nr:PAN domain-containing protein [Aureimonas phyllosphaerae]MBB3937854.1 hypothetical protein [Aureimonas phyllosphaerae]MBB3961815.1 hypothetical protein [Aureimonas phyllosphaerae]